MTESGREKVAVTREQISQARLRELLSYDPDTGLFTVLRDNIRRYPKGTIAGTKGHRGYRIITLEGRKYCASHLVWLYTHGVWPDQEIDHINRDQADDRISNLRQATRQQNAVNQRLNRRNTSGFRGVCRDGPRWKAKIKCNGRWRYLGSFADPEAASRAYERAAAELFGEFAENRA